MSGVPRIVCMLDVVIPYRWDVAACASMIKSASRGLRFPVAAFSNCQLFPPCCLQLTQLNVAFQLR